MEHLTQSQKMRLKAAGHGNHRVRLRQIGDHWLATNGAGHFAWGGEKLRQLVNDGTGSSVRHESLISLGLIPGNDLQSRAHSFTQAKRHYRPAPLDYLILVPTLRCNLACSYCQVSRASERAAGFDWTDDTLSEVVALIRRSNAPTLKIEFQGGEPTLRPDLIEAVIEAVPAAVECQFVICSNLQSLNGNVLALFDRPNVLISTSLDGGRERHARQRQSNDALANRFFENLEFLLDRYGPSKISALPTIDPLNLPDPDELIEAFAGRGLTSIYLRPINYQGFARKRHPDSKDIGRAWLDYHRAFIGRLVELNHRHPERVLEETYFSLLLRRIFRPGSDRHVDLRNPNPVGRDYVVVDYDGRVYPSDEARMLTRSGVIDLAIGDLRNGWDTPERAALEQAATNDGDPACEACAYKPYCGRDIFDDLARYGTIDLPREQTDFCRRHLSLFDLAFDMIHSPDEKVRFSLAQWLNLPGDFPTPVVVS